MTRSEMMGRIGAKNTKPEMVIRRGLHKLGFRFRLHSANLVGRPDLVLPKHRAAIFVNGCFWHVHNGCPYFKMPKTRTDFWQEKLNKNVERDWKTQQALIASGWRVLIVWECATKRLSTEALSNRTAEWLQSQNLTGSISFNEAIL